MKILILLSDLLATSALAGDGKIKNEVEVEKEAMAVEETARKEKRQDRKTTRD